MGEVVGTILGDGVGVAISPLPIVAVILMLFSAGGARHAVTLLVGWALGLTVVCTAFAALGPVAGGDAGPVVGVVKIAVGVVFLVLAARQWRDRPREGSETTLPGWLSSIEQFTLGRAFTTGLALAAINPKNLGLAASAGGSVAASDLGLGAVAVAVATFVVLGSLTVGGPVLARTVAPARTGPALETLRTWLIRNNATVMLVLFLVLGSRLIGDGITALSVLAGGEAWW